MRPFFIAPNHGYACDRLALAYIGYKNDRSTGLTQ